MDFWKEYADLIEESISYLKSGYREKTPPDRKLMEHQAPLSFDREERPVASLPFVNEQSSSDRSVDADSLSMIDRLVSNCKKCRLHKNRRHAVPGEGNPEADIIFIGEGPGEMEDVKGEPFVGKAGQLLTKMLASINLKREEVYITNVVKCRPPNNRTPFPEEIQTCFPYWHRRNPLSGYL